MRGESHAGMEAASCLHCNPACRWNISSKDSLLITAGIVAPKSSWVDGLANRSVRSCLFQRMKFSYAVDWINLTSTAIEALRLN